MNYNWLPPPPIDITLLPAESQFHLSQTGYVQIQPTELHLLMDASYREQALLRPPREGSSFWLNHNPFPERLNNDGRASFLFWRPRDELELTHQMRRARWYFIMSYIRNQHEHLLCWAFTACDHVTGNLFRGRWDLLPSHYSVWSLCRRCAPERLGTDTAAKYPHVCYRYHTEDALRFMQQNGIHRAFPFEEDSCLCQEQLPHNLTPPMDCRIREVVPLASLQEALDSIHLGPIAAYVIMFPELFDSGNKVFFGPTSINSRFGGYHAVTIMSVDIIDGHMVAVCRLSNGREVGMGGYVNVSLSVLYMCVGARRDAGVAATRTPTYLLSNFVLLRGETNPPEQRREMPETNYYMIQYLQHMAIALRSGDKHGQMRAIAGIERLFSSVGLPPKFLSELVTQSGVLPRLVQFLSWDDDVVLQSEAVSALTAIASGTSKGTNVIIDSGAVPLFVRLLGSLSVKVQEQAVRVLGIVADASPECRDHVLSCQAMMPLLGKITEHTTLYMVRTAAWTLSNFCKGKPQPAIEEITPALPVLERLLRSDDQRVLTHSSTALSYLSYCTNERMLQTVIDSGVIPRLVQLLAHPSQFVLVPALRTIGNIVTGDDMQTQEYISSHALPRLLNILIKKYNKDEEMRIKKATCSAISNITAGNTNQIQQVIQAGLIKPLLELLQTGELDVKKEALWAISNATSGGNPDQIKFLVSQGCIKPLCDLLTCPDPRVVTAALEGLYKILKVAEAEKAVDGYQYAQMIDEAGGLKKIEDLNSRHDNTDIYEKTVKFLGLYWLVRISEC